MGQSVDGLRIGLFVHQQLNGKSADGELSVLIDQVSRSQLVLKPGIQLAESAAHRAPVAARAALHELLFEFQHRIVAERLFPGSGEISRDAKQLCDEIFQVRCGREQEVAQCQRRQRSRPMTVFQQPLSERAVPGVEIIQEPLVELAQFRHMEKLGKAEALQVQFITHRHVLLHADRKRLRRIFTVTAAG